MHYCFKSLGGANFPCEEVLQQLNRKQSIRPEAKYSLSKNIYSKNQYLYKHT